MAGHIFVLKWGLTPGRNSYFKYKKLFHLYGIPDQ